jgi:rod shape-determining protein MreD
MAALVLVLQRRLQHFTPLEQIPQLWGVLFIGQLLWIVTGVLSSWTWPGWLALLKPFLEALLWPLMVWLLQIPQRRAHDADLHRPLAM